MIANQRLALVIGNSEYQHLESLKNAISDAKAVKETLDNLGYNTSLKLNMDRDELVGHLYDTLETWKHDAGEIVLFYAGHGVAIGKVLPPELKAFRCALLIIYALSWKGLCCSHKC